MKFVRCGGGSRAGGPIMSKEFLRRFLIVGIVIFLIAGGVSIALGRPRKHKPPWHHPPHPHDPPPVSAAEPTTLSLICLGAAGVAGYRLIRRKRKK